MATNKLITIMTEQVSPYLRPSSPIVCAHGGKHIVPLGHDWYGITKQDDYGGPESLSRVVA